MDITPVLAQGRVAAEARMTDTCQVGWEHPGTVLDESTGEYSPTFEVVYSGVCEFKPGSTQASEVDAASQLLVQQLATLKLPILSSTAVRKDMLVKVMSSVTDPGLVGLEARVKGPFDGAYTTARRFAVEVTS